MSKVVIIMGSKSDLDWAKKIVSFLEKFEVSFEIRVASAHKVPLKCLEILREYEGEENLVFITVAGRSNALSGFVDAQTSYPVIACPPYSDKFGGADIFSSLRMPSGVACMTVIEPSNAALAAVKILALKDKDLKEKLKEYHKKIKEDLYKADEEVRDGKC